MPVRHSKFGSRNILDAMRATLVDAVIEVRLEGGRTEVVFLEGLCGAPEGFFDVPRIAWEILFGGIAIDQLFVSVM